MNRQAPRRAPARVEWIAQMVSAISSSDFSMNRMLAALAGTRPQPAPPPVARPSARPGETGPVGKSELSEHELTRLVAFVGEKSTLPAASNAASESQSRDRIAQSAADSRFAQPTHSLAGRFIDVRA